MRLILEARELPLGTTVCKPTGSKTYTLRDRLKIYGHSTVRDVTADEDTLFLAGKDGDINAISAASRVAVDGTAKQIIALLCCLNERSV